MGRLGQGQASLGQACWNGRHRWVAGDGGCCLWGIMLFNAAACDSSCPVVVHSSARANLPLSPGPAAAIDLLRADSPAVRELAVACVAHAVSAHPRGLGSGWRSVLAALGLAARDSSPTVVGQALDGLQPVVEALFRPGGHTLLR